MFVFVDENRSVIVGKSLIDVVRHYGRWKGVDSRIGEKKNRSIPCVRSRLSWISLWKIRSLLCCMMINLNKMNFGFLTKVLVRNIWLLH